MDFWPLRQCFFNHRIEFPPPPPPLNRLLPETIRPQIYWPYIPPTWPLPPGSPHAPNQMSQHHPGGSQLLSRSLPKKKAIRELSHARPFSLFTRALSQMALLEKCCVITGSRKQITKKKFLASVEPKKKGGSVSYQRMKKLFPSCFAFFCPRQWMVSPFGEIIYIKGLMWDREYDVIWLYLHIDHCDW